MIQNLKIPPKHQHLIVAMLMPQKKKNAITPRRPLAALLFETSHSLKRQ